MCMIKLTFNNVEDISKTAIFPEKNFITVIYQEFCLYLSIVRTLRTLWNFWTHPSGFNCIWNCGWKTQQKLVWLQKIILANLALSFNFWARRWLAHLVSGLACNTRVIVDARSSPPFSLMSNSCNKTVNHINKQTNLNQYHIINQSNSDSIRW